MSNYNGILTPSTKAIATATATEGVLPQAFSVSEINTMVADALTASLPGTLSVEGEVSNLSLAASGHRYFSLKDANSTISCALFRSSANRISREILNTLKNGDKIVVKASLSVFQPRGSYQLIVNDVEPAGFGALAKAFAALKQKLDTAGYTANARKRPIPPWATAVAVVTSASGAAVRDVLTTLKRRAPFIPVVVYPTLVQGQGAPQEIVQALSDANADATASVILLVRGGGSLEDLQAFNDESVAMAVVNSRLPVVTGVGHETDFTIVDFVSDARAPTPTAAAEWVSPDKQALTAALQKQQQRLYGSMENALDKRRRHLAHQLQRLMVQHPQHGLQQQSQRLDELRERLRRALLQRLASRQQQLSQLHRQLLSGSPQHKLNRSREYIAQRQNALLQAISRRVEVQRQRLTATEQRLSHTPQRLVAYRQQLKGLQARLTLLSPLGVLGRGYALAFNEDGRLLRHAASIAIGDNIRIRLADGELTAQVQSHQAEKSTKPDHE